MTEFAHAVNFTMSFRATVLPGEINKIRKDLQRDDCQSMYMLYDIHLTKESSDEEITNYLGLENYRDFLLTECVNMEMEEHHVYDAEDTKRLKEQYKERLRAFREANKK